MRFGNRIHECEILILAMGAESPRGRASGIPTTMLPADMAVPQILPDSPRVRRGLCFC